VLLLNYLDGVYKLKKVYFIKKGTVFFRWTIDEKMNSDLSFFTLLRVEKGSWNYSLKPWWSGNHFVLRTSFILNQKGIGLLKKE